MRYAVTIEQTGSHSFCASCPDIPNVVSCGDSLEDVMIGYREALDHYIRSCAKVASPFPSPEPWLTRSTSPTSLDPLSQA